MIHAKNPEPTKPELRDFSEEHVEHSEELTLTPKVFSSAVFRKRLEDPLMEGFFLESLAEVAKFYELEPKEVPSLLTPQLKSSLESEAHSRKLLKEKRSLLSILSSQ